MTDKPFPRWAGNLLASFVALVLIALLVATCSSCVTVSTPPTAENPEGGRALVPGLSSESVAGLGDSGLLDFLPAPLRLLLLYAGVRLGQSAVTKSGRANWAVIADGDASWRGTGAAILHNVAGTSSPPEARAKLEPKP